MRLEQIDFSPRFLASQLPGLFERCAIAIGAERGEEVAVAVNRAFDEVVRRRRKHGLALLAVGVEQPRAAHPDLPAGHRGGDADGG